MERDSSKYLQVDPRLNKAEEVTEEIKVDDRGAMIVDRHRSIKIDHAGTANMVIKHINTTPGLSTESRLIMTMKAMNPGLKNRIIAHEMKISEYDVSMYEKEGVLRCADHIKKMRLEDSVHKFNLDGMNEQQIKNLNRDKANPLITGISQ